MIARSTHLETRFTAAPSAAFSAASPPASSGMGAATPLPRWVRAATARREPSPCPSKVERRMRRPTQMRQCPPAPMQPLPSLASASVSAAGLRCRLPSGGWIIVENGGHGWAGEDLRGWPSVGCFWDTAAETGGVGEPVRGEGAHVGLDAK